MDRLVLFTGPNCPACKIVKEQLDRKEIKYETVDVGDPAGARIAAGHSIMSLPTMLVYKGDKIMRQYSGSTIVSKLESKGDV